MGEQSRAHNIFRTLHALGATLSSLGATVDVPGGVSALEKSLEQSDRENIGLFSSTVSQLSSTS